MEQISTNTEAQCKLKISITKWCTINASKIFNPKKHRSA